MPDFNSVLNVNTLLNGGALVLVAMSFVWLLIQQPKMLGKIADRFDIALREDRAAHHEEVKVMAAAMDRLGTRIESRLVVNEMKIENERKSRG